MASNIKHLMTVADLDASSLLFPGLQLKLSDIFKFPQRR